MRIRLINNGSTITNLHFHGMHVSLPQVRGLRKHSLALREGGLGPDGSWADYTTLSTDATELYVNGMRNPRITIRPGETQFWQIGNIGVATYYALGLDNLEFTVVEEDGAMVWRTWQTDTLIMPPGKRYGVLVTARRGRGTVRLRQLGYNQGKSQWPARPLMRMRITGDQDRPVSVPTHLADPPGWLTGPVANRRVLTLSQDIVDGDPQFYIDGLIFDELTFKDVIQVRLGTTEESVIRNASSKMAGSPENEEHPFHIHVNDFVVVGRGDWDPLTNKTSNRKVAPMRS